MDVTPAALAAPGSHAAMGNGISDAIGVQATLVECQQPPQCGPRG
jgi:hypothetical protein